VDDGSGSALDISVQINASTQSLRIGFDDGNAASAPVSALASSVVVAPSSIRADGLQCASITISPRDANGILLGRGLSVAIDPSLLWPAQLSGPIVDLGDGSYRASVVSSLPGVGTVRVVAEGIDLGLRPTITATVVDPSSSLRDLAIAELTGMLASGGPLSQLAARTGAQTPQGDALSAAISGANTALAMLVSGDFNHDDNAVKTYLDAALYSLAPLLDAPGSLDALDVRDAMDDVLGIARLLAVFHLERGVAACGACDGAGNPNKVCDAEAALASADAMRAAINPDWRSTVDTYARVIELSLQAVQAC
jgi:hypothetical protein